MEVVWFAIAAFFGIVWAWISISQRIKGGKHQKRGRELLAMGNWQEASLEYKLAILQRLDSEEKMSELVSELSALYKKYGHDVDLGYLLECPGVLSTLNAGTGNQKKKNELLTKLYIETGAFLDKLPGYPLPEK